MSIVLVLARSLRLRLPSASDSTGDCNGTVCTYATIAAMLALMACTRLFMLIKAGEVLVRPWLCGRMLSEDGGDCASGGARKSSPAYISFPQSLQDFLATVPGLLASFDVTGLGVASFVAPYLLVQFSRDGRSARA